MKSFYERTIIGFVLEEDRRYLIELETHKRNILVFREKEARQKSRALWLICGDDNTPFFHKFAAHRKNINSIWNIHDDSGVLVEGTENIAGARIKHFEQLFKEEDDLHLPEIVQSAGFFPSSIIVEDNIELMKPVTLQDIKH